MSSHTDQPLAPSVSESGEIASAVNEGDPSDAQPPAASAAASPGIQDDDIESDPEVVLLSKFRLALGSTLRMLECARDDLVRMADRMDRLTAASEFCREQLVGQDGSKEAESNNCDDRVSEHDAE